MNHELGLWDKASVTQPRDNRGRFAKVRHTAERRLVLVTAQLMRAQMGLPLDGRLAPR